MKRRASVSACVFVCLLFSAGCAFTKQSYLTKGNRLYAAGKYNEALLNYRKAIQKDPTFGEAYYHLGLTALKLNDGGQAYDAFSRAAQLQPNNLDAKKQFADLCLTGYLADLSRPKSLYNQIIRLSDDFLARDANSHEGLRLKAYLAATDRKLDEAIPLFRRALAANPTDKALGTALVQALFQNGQREEGEKLGSEIIARKGDGPIYAVMYSWYYNSNRIPLAEEVLKLRAANNPKEPLAILELARHYARVQKPAEMKSALQRILDDPKNFPKGKMLVGDYYAAIQAYPEALRYYEDGARSSSAEKLDFEKREVDALIALGRRDEAATVVEEILKQDPKDEEALQVRATLWLNNGRPDKVKAAAGEFQALLKRHPEDALLWFKAGRADVQADDPEGARSCFVEAVNRRRDFVEARYELAELGLTQQKPNETVQFATEILSSHPHDERAKILRARGLIEMDNFSAARAELNDVAKEFPKSADGRFYLGLLALRENKYQDAINVFGKMQPEDDPRVVIGLSSAYSSLKQSDKALQVLNDGIRKWPKSVMVREQFASLEALRGQYDEAIADFRNMLSSNPKSIQLRLRLGEAYEMKGDYQEAVSAYRAAQAVAPKDAVVNLSLAAALAKAGRPDEAGKEYRGLLKAHPDSSFAMNSLAYLLSETGGNLDEALSMARRAVETTPGQPSFVDTIGYIYLKKGMRDSAIQTFAGLVRKYPRYPTFRYHLAMALLEKGDKAGARKELETALSNHPSRGEEAKIKALVSKTQS